MSISILVDILFIWIHVAMTSHHVHSVMLPHKFVSTPTSLLHLEQHFIALKIFQTGFKSWLLYSSRAELEWVEQIKWRTYCDSPSEMPSWPIPCQVDWISAQATSVLHLISLLLLQGWDEASVWSQGVADISWLELKDLGGTWLSTANLRAHYLTNGHHKCCLPCRLLLVYLGTCAVSEWSWYQLSCGGGPGPGPGYQQQIWR